MLCQECSRVIVAKIKVNGIIWEFETFKSALNFKRSLDS